MILKFDQLIVFLKTNTILTIDIKTLNNMVCLVKLDILKYKESGIKKLNNRSINIYGYIGYHKLYSGDFFSMILVI